MSEQGVYSILPTPFQEDGSIDLPSLERLIAFQLEAGVHGLSVLGFMGEAHKLSSAERRAVVRTTVAAAGGLVPVWAGVRAFGAAAAAEQAREAEELGAKAVFVAPPEVQEDGAIVSHYREVASSVGIPVSIHDYPESFHTVLSPALIARLASEIPGVRSIKLEQPPVGPKLTRIRELAGPDFSIFGGLGGVYFLEELERGAIGTMTGFSFPEVLVAIFTAFQNDPPRAAVIFDHYCPLMRYEFQPGIGLALRKHVFKRRGLIRSAAVRMPGPILDAVTIAELERTVARAGLELTAAVQPVRGA